MRVFYLAFLIAGSLTGQTPGPGTLTVDKTRVTLQAASAVSYPGGTGRYVSVLLSDKSANQKTFAEYTRIGAGERYVPGTFEGAWAAMHIEKELSGFSFTIDSNNQILTNQILLGGQDAVFSLSSDDLVLEITRTSPRLTGRIRSKQPVLDLGDRKVSLNATFDVAVKRQQ